MEKSTDNERVKTIWDNLNGIERRVEIGKRTINTYNTFP